MQTARVAIKNKKYYILTEAFLITKTSTKPTMRASPLMCDKAV